MKKYIGESNYSETNHVRNFCLYWIKASKGSGDEWRKENDLDCLYFNGDLRADTLISCIFRETCATVPMERSAVPL